MISSGSIYTYSVLLIHIRAHLLNNQYRFLSYFGKIYFVEKALPVSYARGTSHLLLYSSMPFPLMIALISHNVSVFTTSIHLKDL